MLFLILHVLVAQDIASLPAEVHRITVPQEYAFEASFGTGLDVAELDGDGFEDLVVGANTTTFGRIPSWEVDGGAVYILRSPAFAFSEQLTEDPIDAGHRYGSAVAAGDTNRDGWAEVAISWPYGGEVRRGTDHQKVLAPIVGGSLGTSHLLFCDVDLDGYQNLVDVKLSSPREIIIYYGPDLSVTDSVIPNDPPIPFYPHNIAQGDVNGDGHVDLVTGSPFTSNLGSSDGVAWCFLGPDFVEYHLISDPTPDDDGRFTMSIAVGDYDNDGYDDIATTSASEICSEAYRCGEALVFFGPDFTRTHRFRDPFPGRDEVSGTGSVATVDINVDSIDDLVISTTVERVKGLKAGTLWVFFGPDFSTWERQVREITLEDEGSGFGALLRVGDVTGDGLDDIVASASARDGYGNGGAGAVFVIDFSTRFPFVSYSGCAGSPLALRGEGSGKPDGSSKLVLEGLDGGFARLLVGVQPCSGPVGDSRALGGCDPKLLVVPQRIIDLGPATGQIEYPLRIPSDFLTHDRLQRFRFQATETKSDGTLVLSNGVTWTVH